MNLLISNCDGTLNYGVLITKSNILSIKKFMEMGNKFGLATKNNFSYIKRKLNKHKLRPDYISISNGLVLFDRNYNIESAKFIEQKEIKEIEYFLNPFVNEKIVTLNEYDKRSMQNIIDVVGHAKSVSDLRLICKYLYLYFPNYCLVNKDLEFHIRKKSNRVENVDEIKKIENVNDSNIYTIGKDLEDLEMIKKYNGYVTPFANRKVLKESNGIVPSVRKLIKTMKY